MIVLQNQLLNACQKKHLIWYWLSKSENNFHDQVKKFVLIHIFYVSSIFTFLVSWIIFQWIFLLILLEPQMVSYSGKVRNQDSIQAVSRKETTCVQFLLIIWNNFFFKFLSCCGNYLWSLWIKLISAFRFPCVLCTNFRIYRTLQRNDFLIQKINCFFEFFNLLFFGLLLCSQLFDLSEFVINCFWCCFCKKWNPWKYSEYQCNNNEDCKCTFPEIRKSKFCFCCFNWWIKILWVVHMWKN